MARTSRYRIGSSQNAGSLASFREQMADFARAERLLELRTARHLSRERAALEIGVSSKTLYAWEHGSKIQWDNAKRAAAFYGVDPESLVSREIDGLPEGEPNQLDRIEAKLDEILSLLAPSIDEAISDVENLPPPDEQQPATGASSARTPGRRRAAS